MFRWYHIGCKPNIGNYLSDEQVIALSRDKRLDTGETQEKKIIPSTVNFPAKVTGIRHTDHGDVLDYAVLQEAF